MRNLQTRTVNLAVVALAAVWLMSAGVAAAQDGGATPPSGPAPERETAPAPDAAAPASEDDPDLSPTPMVPDFYYVNLPTTLRLPQYKLAFRVTHRFTRPLNQGSFGSLVGDAFGLDAGAQIGLELRFSPIRAAQVGVYRTSDKTINFFGSYNVVQTTGGLPISVSATASVEGTGKFKDSYSPSLGAAVTTTLGNRVAVSLLPTWVNNSNPLPSDLVDHNDSVYLGIGTRIRVSKRSYLVAEVSPNIYGYKGGNANLQNTSKYAEGRPLIAFGIEGQVGGHVFQVNFSNAFATTPANIARGAAAGKTHWYLGFNISRKFY